MTMHNGSRRERDALNTDSQPPNDSTRHGVRLERRLPGSLEEVWTFLTAADQLERLLTGREGGQSTPRRRGEFRRAEPPRLLTFTWMDTLSGADGPKHLHFLVTVELTSENDAVRLALTIDLQDHHDEQPAFGEVEPCRLS